MCSKCAEGWPELLLSTEVAAALETSVPTVHRWAREGTLISVELPSGQRRFHRTYIERVLLVGVVEANNWWRAQRGAALARHQRVQSAGHDAEVSDGGGV